MKKQNNQGVEMAQENSSANSAEETLNPDVDFSQEDGLAVDSGDFFESLDREVNGMILDKENTVEATGTKETQVTDPAPAAITDDHQHDWEKRYRDSSSEAQRLKSQLDETSQYEPIINRLKTDTGMVEAIKSYIDNGNKPQDVKQALNLPEDFVFDLDDAMGNNESLSAKALEHTISSVVDRRVNSQLEQDRQVRSEATQKESRDRNALEFKERMKLSNDQYNDMMDWANNHETSLEDIYYLKNKDARDKQVATGTKAQMLEQMKSVRNIPQSVSNHNTTVKDVKHEDQVFESLKEVDSGLDTLFG
mgnify:CR=1 FL=1